MDCLGKEVTHKMKSARMAKLMELGIKADVDLLEYIMLMISNKRTKAGMIRDLSLFLGSSTTIFVTWLHQVLSKLQEVTISTQVNPPKPTKAENVTSEKAQENAEAKLPDTVVKCKKRERTPSGDDQDYLNIRADTEADPIDDLQSVIDESAARSSLTTHTTEKKEPDRAISTKPLSNKVKDSQSSKTSTSSEKQKSVEEQSKDDGGAKRKRISPPAKEREKELLKDEGDVKKRRVSPSRVKERESVRDDSELRRKRLSSPIAKEREKDDSEVKKKRVSSPLREKDRETLKDDGQLKRKRLLSPAKEKDDVELRRKRLVSPSKEQLKDDGVLRRRRLSPDRVKDGDKRSGSESGRKDKPLYDVRELLNKRKAEKSAVPDEKRGREGERRRKSPRRTVSERERDSDRERDRERMRERVRERENQKRSSSRELSGDRRRPPSKVVRVESSVHDVSEARSGRSNVSTVPKNCFPSNYTVRSLSFAKMKMKNWNLQEDATGGSAEKRKKKSAKKEEDKTDFKRLQTSLSLSSLSSDDDVHLELHGEESEEEEEDDRNAVISHKMAAEAFEIAFKYARQQNASDDDLCVMEKWIKYSNCCEKS
ncbi:hypothetical protein LSTR_LSTR009456 [Laodelphax striatellus]|uniref:Zinc finger CCCH domain-containing protein 14 n=1 Tax=Laodelphax striatellus TaxID=195883 RepID=A0A482WFK6_LAOST|nr:hypothetical protein LSTR_LSTR009456 [Laodelphax striatellus]